MFFKLADTFWRGLNPIVPGEVDEAIQRVPTRLNEYGYDPWGFSPKIARYAYALAWPFYRHYFRCEVEGAENIPKDRVIVAANHSGIIPWDGLMVSMAMLLEPKTPRLARGMAERWFPTLPFFSPLMQRMGHVLGDPHNCRELLRREEAIMVYPEGTRGIGKTFWHAYELQDFGTGFVRLSLETGAPIVPCAVVGAEEQTPAIAHSRLMARLTGFPYFPITPTFPLLGPAGLWPLPVRYHIYFDEPVRFDGVDANAPDDEVERLVEVVKAKIHRLIQYGLETRQGVFA